MSITVAVIRRTPMASKLMVRGLRAHRQEFALVVCDHTAKDFLKQITEKRPDVAVVSPILPDGPEASANIVRRVRAASPGTHVIVLLDSPDPPQVIEAFTAGARGVLGKSDPPKTLRKCIRAVHAGQVWANSREQQMIVKALAERGQPAPLLSAQGLPLLTPREDQIVRMVMEGMNNREISAKLGVSPHTLSNHVFHIYEKLGISSRAELVLYALSKRPAA